MSLVFKLAYVTEGIKVKKSVIFFVVAVLLSSFICPAFAAPSYTFRLSADADEKNPYVMGAQKFADLVYEKTGGDIKIDIYPDAQLGGQRAAIEGLIFGTIDFSMSNTAVLGNFVPETAVFDLPFLFRDIPHAYHALDTVGMDIFKGLEPKGVKIVTCMENGVRHLTNSVRPVTKPDDVKGLKIRVMEQPVYMEMIRSWGGSPTPMAFSELFTALQQNVVDGQENPWGHIWTKRFFEVQKYISETGHTYSPELLAVSMKTWNRLPENYRKVVKECADQARDWERNLCREKEADFRNKVIATGKSQVILAKDVDRKAFAEASRPVWKKFEDKVGKDNIDRILAVQ